MRSLPLLLLTLVAASQVLGTVRRASSSAELDATCRSIEPGDTIVIPNGTYTDQHFVLKAKGTAEKPITLRAETPGKVVLTGSSRLSIGGEYLVVDGLLFRDGAIESGSIIEFRGHSSPLAHNCVLRNTAVIDYNPDDVDTRYCWVSLHGSGNVVENCHFSGQKHSGVTLCIWLRNGEPAKHAIRRSYFGDRSRGNGNGFETIRIGTSARSMTAAHCMVAENLFERCNGEIEIISNKSCENRYVRNTFRECSGCLTLRHGNRCTVEGNVFLGGKAKGAGGVRVIGEGHRVVGNYFSGTKGRAGAAISLQAGIPDSPLSGYFQVKNCLIDNNVFSDNPGPLFALDASYGKRRCTLLPKSVTISNCILVPADSAKPMIVAKQSPDGITWQDNIAIGTNLGIQPPTGIELVPAVPNDWQSRLEAKPVGRNDVGPVWLRSQTTAP